jgi:glucose/arabinose dehydrogenase
MKRLKLVLGYFFAIAIAQASPKTDVLGQLTLPVGFKISIYADDVPNARSLSLGDNGTVFVGTRQQGDVYALQDKDNDGIAERRYVIASGLYMPNGVAFRNGDLYVAETHRILKFAAIEQHLDSPPKPQVVYEGLPSDKHHGWKYLRFGPDGKLYSAVGAPCNICVPEKPIYTSLFRVNPDGSQFETLAQGIRNTVGFDWNPESGTLFFTDNGRDHLGDDVPPDELNSWTAKGQHFGYPFCHGGTLLDPEFGKGKNCKDYRAPEWRIKAHMAPLGMRFYTGSQFPKRYQNHLFVAQHGSWNRSKPHGYRVALIKFANGHPVKEQSFINGWLTADEKTLGRPVDILQMPKGNLLISDDTLGVVYNVTYKK